MQRDNLVKAIENALNSDIVKGYLGEDGSRQLEQVKFVIDLKELKSDNTIKVCLLTKKVDYEQLEPTLTTESKLDLPEGICHFLGSKVRCCGYSENGEENSDNARVWVLM